MVFSIVSNLQTNLFRIDLPKKMDQYTGVKWLIDEHYKDNQSQTLKDLWRLS